MQILCVGKNDELHASELGDKDSGEPIFFLKPESSLIRPGETILLPDVGRVDFEVELVVRVGSPLQVAVGIDVTARDLQSAAKAAGKPWTKSKGFRTFAAVGEFEDAPDDVDALVFRLYQNDELRQVGSLATMRWGVKKILAEAATWIDLRDGDLVFCGTPSGVGPIAAGDELRVELDGRASVFSVANSP